jgi:Doubled CXXCH motif (Paired_CXXCH_1)/Cytochrome c554 and c-prime
MNNAKYKLGFFKMIIFKISNKTVCDLFSSLLYIVLLLSLSNCNTKDKKEYSKIKNVSFEMATFVGSKSCKSCHEEEFKSWEGSHHDQAMKIADSTTILADFNNTTFTHNKVKNSFFKKGGAFYVNTEGPDGNYYDYKIVYTFGFTPLQQYIVQFPNGEYQCLLTAWDTVKNKWFHLQPNLDIIHDEWINWSGGSQRWNTMCADCHSTNLHKNYDSKTTTYNTNFSEINVACEACHGPSSEHNAYYENPIKSLIPKKLDMEPFLPSKVLVDKCARCHSRRSQITKSFDNKDDFLDHYYPSLLEDPVYELDGQIKDEDYVYGSFVQSKMYSNGISCRDCHDVHSLKLKKIGNELCLTCHVPAYNEPSHHFHKLNTEASQCINCHMTGKTYMGNDFRRDHSFRVPRPDQTVKYDTPNACNKCHTDKSAEWASDFIVEKYGSERQDHFSDHLLKGYFEDTNGFKELFSNSNYPELARATALKQYTNQSLSYDEILALTAYLKDSSAFVRNETVQAFQRIGNPDWSNKIKPLLNDSIRIVRISSARYFNNSREDMSTNVDFKNANKEYLEQLDMNSDFASGQQQIALYYQAKGKEDAAVKA